MQNTRGSAAVDRFLSDSWRMSADAGNGSIKRDDDGPSFTGP